MDPWTPERRNEFIMKAVNSKEMHGKSGPYHYNVYPKQDNSSDNEDVKRAMVTQSLASSMYNSTARKISLNFYGLLMNKMMTHPMLCHEINKNIVILMKGSNAHSYMVDFSQYNDVFRFSDLDISVCINPNLTDDVFYSIKKQCEIMVKQAISQYKRTLDHMLFLGSNDVPQGFMTQNEINEFKDTYKTIMSNLSMDDDEFGQFFTPFDDVEIRNKCSRNSFLLTNNKGVDNSVVMVEVPHFDMCERIPLRKTPLFCSFNETIDFLRDGNNKVGRFNLYRLRMNNIYAKFDQDGSLIKEEKVVADFIDVSVLDKGDAELEFFWAHGRSVNVFDTIVGFWIMMPDIYTSVSELERILSIYDSSSGKKEKRMKKLEILKNML